MPLETDHSLRLGRLEDKFALHEPVLISLHGLVTVADEIDKIQTDLQTLRDSKTAMKEKVAGMLKMQDKGYKDILALCQERAGLAENCPIKNVVTKIDAMETNLINVEKVLDSLKMKGWDLLFRIVPWALLFGVTMWTAIKQ